MQKINTFKESFGSDGRERQSLWCPLPPLILRVESIHWSTEESKCRLKGAGSSVGASCCSLFIALSNPSQPQQKQNENKTTENNWHRQKIMVLPTWRMHSHFDAVKERISTHFCPLFTTHTGDLGFQIFFFLNKAEEYSFQMKHTMEINCAKVITKPGLWQQPSICI